MWNATYIYEMYDVYMSQLIWIGSDGDVRDTEKIKISGNIFSGSACNWWLLLIQINEVPVMCDLFFMKLR